MNPRFREIREALARLETYVNDKGVWGEVSYINKHLDLLEKEYRGLQGKANSNE